MTSSTLFAVEPTSEGAVVVKKAGFGMVVVAPKKTAAAAAAAAASQVDAPLPPVVEATTPPPVVTPPPQVAVETVTTKVSKVAASAPVVNNNPPPPLPEPQPRPVLEILPKPDTLPVGATTKSTLSASDVLDALRQKHWASMPKVTEMTTDSGGSKAPLLMDVMKERSGEAAGYVQNNGPETMTTFQNNLNQARVRLFVDKDVYANIREQAVALKDSETPLTWEQMQQWLGVEAIRTNLGKLQDTDALLRQLKLDRLVYNLKMNSQAVQTSWNEFTASLAALESALSSQQQTSADDLVQLMNLKETGGWYMGAAGLVTWMALTASSSVSSADNQKIILTEAAMPSKASDVSPAETELEMDAVVNEQVNKLKEATAAVYEQLNEIKAEKDTRAYEVAAMKSELQTVMQQLNSNRAEEQKLLKSLEQTQEQLDYETSDLRQQLQARLAAEEDLRDQLAETKDLLAAEMAKVADAKKQAEIEVQQAEAQVLKLEAEKEQMEEEMKALRLEMEDLQNQLYAKYMSKPPKEPQVLKESPGSGEFVVNGSGVANGSGPNGLVNGDSSATTSMEPTAASATATATLPKSTRGRPKSGAKKKKATTTTKTPRKTKTATKATAPPTLPTTGTPSYADLSKAFFTDISDPLEPETALPKVGAVKKAAAVKKSALPKKSVMDWSQLSVSTLKRKTVKELTGYLLNKGGETTGPDGKTLKKDFLVQNILATAH